MRSFVHHITDNSADKVMVMTITDLGINFEFDVNAGGAETDQQFNFIIVAGSAAFVVICSASRYLLSILNNRSFNGSSNRDLVSELRLPKALSRCQ
jgi:hypothetical protein